jgi:hypothetical protein
MAAQVAGCQNWLFEGSMRRTEEKESSKQGDELLA